MSNPMDGAVASVTSHPGGMSASVEFTFNGPLSLMMAQKAEPYIKAALNHYRSHELLMSGAPVMVEGLEAILEPSVIPLFEEDSVVQASIAVSLKRLADSLEKPIITGSPVPMEVTLPDDGPCPTCNDEGGGPDGALECSTCGKGIF